MKDVPEGRFHVRLLPALPMFQRWVLVLGALAVLSSRGAGRGTAPIPPRGERLRPFRERPAAPEEEPERKKYYQIFSVAEPLSAALE